MLTFEGLLRKTSFHDVPANFVEAARNWAKILDDPEASTPPLPTFPENPGLDPAENFMAGFLKACLKHGYNAAQAIGHDPLAPHLPESARPGASTFNPGFDPMEWNNENICVLRCEGGPGVRIFVVATTSGPCGINRMTRIKPEEVYTMRTVHGWLMPCGPVEEVSAPTDRMTFVFTYEGPDTGFVWATGHPGDTDPVANRAGIAEGDKIRGDVLLSKNFYRGVPTTEEKKED